MKKLLSLIFSLVLIIGLAFTISFITGCQPAGEQPEEQVEEQCAKIMKGQSQTVADLFEKSDKPTVVYTFRDLENLFMRGLLDRGIPVFPEPDRAAQALGALVRYTKLRDKILSRNGGEDFIAAFAQTASRS